MEGVGERVREARLFHGLSQADLATQAGVDKMTVNGIETGKHTPRPSTLRKLAKGLGIEVAEMLGKALAPVGSSR